MPNLRMAGQHRLNGCHSHRLDDSAFGDDRRDEFGRSHIKRWVEGGNSIGSGLTSESVRDLGRRSLLNRNLLSACQRQIERAARCGDVERQAVRSCQTSDRVSANLVGRVAVCRDPIRSDNDGLNSSLPHHGRSHRIANYCDRHSALREFPCRKSRPLQQWPRLVSEHSNRLACGNRRVNYGDAVPSPAVARPPALQCVRIVSPSLSSSAPCRPIAIHIARSSRSIASFSQ